jgi:hypothetical protein
MEKESNLPDNINYLSEKLFGILIYDMVQCGFSPKEAYSILWSIFI